MIEIYDMINEAVVAAAALPGATDEFRRFAGAWRDYATANLISRSDGMPRASRGLEEAVSLACCLAAEAAAAYCAATRSGGYRGRGDPERQRGTAVEAARRAGAHIQNAHRMLMEHPIDRFLLGGWLGKTEARRPWQGHDDLLLSLRRIGERVEFTVTTVGGDIVERRKYAPADNSEMAAFEAVSEAAYRFRQWSYLKQPPVAV